MHDARLLKPMVGLSSPHRSSHCSWRKQTLRSQRPSLLQDTEFPGVVARPVGNFKNSGEYHYQTLRCT